MLNIEHFELLAGNPSKWDDQTKELLAKGESLPNIQIRQANQGRLAIELVQTIYGYSIRYASGLQDWAILYGSRMLGRTVTKEEAIEWGTQWVSQDPNRREFFARK